VVLVGVLVLRRWAGDPSRGWSVAVGCVLVVAVVTRETTLVLGVPATVAGVVVARRGRLDRRTLLWSCGPPSGALAIVLATAWWASGRALGTAGFVDAYGTPVGAPAAADALWQLGHRTLLPFTYGGWSPVAVALALVAVALVVWGLVLARRAGLGVEVWVVAGMFAVQVLGLTQAVTSGLTHITGRLLLPTYPVALAVAVAGWTRRPQASARWSVPAAVGVLAVWFFGVDLLPAYGSPWD
jgi:hypothetical protein